MSAARRPARLGDGRPGARSALAAGAVHHLAFGRESRRRRGGGGGGRPAEPAGQEREEGQGGEADGELADVVDTITGRHHQEAEGDRGGERAGGQGQPMAVGPAARRPAPDGGAQGGGGGEG